MEKFAVDLDAVLDDFELNEDEPAAPVVRKADQPQFPSVNSCTGGALSEQRSVLELPHPGQPNLHRVPPEHSNFATLMYDAPYEAPTQPDSLNTKYTNSPHGSALQSGFVQENSYYTGLGGGGFQPDIITNHKNGRTDNHTPHSSFTSSSSSASSLSSQNHHHHHHHTASSSGPTLHPSRPHIPSQHHPPEHEAEPTPHPWDVPPGVFPSAPVMGGVIDQIQTYQSQSMSHTAVNESSGVFHPAYTNNNNPFTCLSMGQAQPAQNNIPAACGSTTRNQPTSNSGTTTGVYTSNSNCLHGNNDDNITNQGRISSQDVLPNTNTNNKAELDTDTASESSVQDSMTSTMSSLSPPSVSSEYTDMEQKYDAQPLPSKISPSVTDGSDARCSVRKPCDHDNQMSVDLVAMATHANAEPAQESNFSTSHKEEEGGVAEIERERDSPSLSSFGINQVTIDTVARQPQSVQRPEAVSMATTSENVIELTTPISTPNSCCNLGNVESTDNTADSLKPSSAAKDSNVTAGSKESETLTNIPSFSVTPEVTTSPTQKPPESSLSGCDIEAAKVAHSSSERSQEHTGKAKPLEDSSSESVVLAENERTVDMEAVKQPGVTMERKSSLEEQAAAVMREPIRTATETVDECDVLEEVAACPGSSQGDMLSAADNQKDPASVAVQSDIQKDPTSVVILSNIQKDPASLLIQSDIQKDPASAVVQSESTSVAHPDTSVSSSHVDSDTKTSTDILATSQTVQNTSSTGITDNTTNLTEEQMQRSKETSQIVPSNDQSDLQNSSPLPVTDTSLQSNILQGKVSVQPSLTSVADTQIHQSDNTVVNTACNKSYGANNIITQTETRPTALPAQDVIQQGLPPGGIIHQVDSATSADQVHSASSEVQRQTVAPSDVLSEVKISSDCTNNSNSSLDHDVVVDGPSALNPLYEAIHNAEISAESPHASLEDQMLKEMIQQPLEFESLLPTATPAAVTPSEQQPAVETPVIERNNNNVQSIEEQMRNGGARPKDSSLLMRKNRPNSLLGLSTVSLEPKPAVPTPEASSHPDVTTSHSTPNTSLTQSANHALHGLSLVDSAMTVAGDGNGILPPPPPPAMSHDAINRQLAQQGYHGNHNNVLMRKKQINQEIKQQMDSQALAGGDNRALTTVPPSGSMALPAPQQTQGVPFPGGAADAGVLPRPPQGRPSSAPPNFLQPPTPLPGAPVKQKRPTSLNLPPRSTFPTPAVPIPPQREADETSEATPTPTGDSEQEVTLTDPVPEHEEVISDVNADIPGLVTAPPVHTIPGSNVQLGKAPPEWIPDSEAPNCMLCEARFTFTKRRHHCRACGKVFCSTCCNLRCKLEYMENKEARVCSLCFQAIVAAAARVNACAPSPNPNNPNEYCSTIPPLQQAGVSGSLNAPPLTVMVPVGVLKREGSQRRGEPKQVMFSDGIRPGGDLTELDGSSEQRVPPRKMGRTQKKVERTSAPSTENTSDNQPKPATIKAKTLKTSDSRRNPCLIPPHGLPPVILSTGVKGDYSVEENPDVEKVLPQIRSVEDPSPVIFAINKNLLVMVKILNLDCCVNRVCWCFSTRGLCTVGQDELLIVLEYLPEEKTIPTDIFQHFQNLYDQASKGNTVGDLGHTIFSQAFLGTRDHGGFLYIRSTFQCVQKLLVPNAPFLVGVLLQKWETPWAKVFPLRLMLRLGAEFRYYPCPLISVRNRKPVFGEIGHTIMNLLADFRNYQYMLPQIRGVTIHMENKKTYINFPRNRYNEVMKVINNSNDHVVALGSNFSTEADSHLVCMQNEEGNYQTQAINIQNKPRKMTGASFVVFNGALKSSSGLSAKSSIVEDGLMVQITAEAMMALKTALREMTDYTIGCGTLDAPQPEELVIAQWMDDDRNVNIGVKSPIDNKLMDGVESIRINNATDYVGENKTIRWTEVFFIQNAETGSRCEPVDLSRLAETLASACSVALTPHLDKLKEAGLTKIGLRVTVDAEQVGYDVGSNGEKLPGFYMNDLDNELIPVIHNAASQSQDNPVAMELIFYIID